MVLVLEGALVLTDNEGVNMEGAVLIALVQFVGTVASGYLFVVVV